MTRVQYMTLSAPVESQRYGYKNYNCNTQNGSGVDFINGNNLDGGIFSDGYPSALTSIPASRRILKTDSSATALCESLFGVRDVVGNVNEWSREHYRCKNSYSCVFEPVTSGIDYLSFAYNGLVSYSSLGLSTHYQFNGETGPCQTDDPSSNTCSATGELISRQFTFEVEDSNFNQASHLIPQIGMPGVSSYGAGRLKNSTLINFYKTDLYLGPTGKFHLNRDRYLNTGAYYINANINMVLGDGDYTTGTKGLTGLVNGGSYRHSDGATVFFELLHSYTQASDVGFRCVYPISY